MVTGVARFDCDDPPCVFDGLAVAIQTAKHIDKRADRGGIFGPQRQYPAIRRECFVVALGCFQGIAQIEPGVAMARIETHRALIIGDGLVRTLQCGQHSAEIAQCLGILRRFGYRLLIMYERIFETLLGLQDAAKIVIDIRKIGIEAGRSGQRVGRLGQMAQLKLCKAEEVQNANGAGILAQHLLVSPNGLVDPSRTVQLHRLLKQRVNC